MLVLLIVACSYLCSLCLHVHGAPPIRPLAEAGDAARLFLSELVSTELTLGSSSAPAAQLEHTPRQTLHPFTHSNLSPFKGRQAASNPDLTSRSAAGTSASGSARGFTFPFAGPEGPSTSAVDVVSAARSLQHGAGFASEQDLDAFFGDLLLREGTTVWRLPQATDYVPSTWFDATYSSYVKERRADRPGGRNWVHSPKREMTPELLRLVTWYGRELFSHKGRIYKLRFPGSAANGWQGGEVLARYLYTDFEAYGVKIRPNTLLVWKTSHRGSRLAFLGLYHCPKKAIGELARLPGSSKFDVYFDGTGHIDLIPRPEPPRVNAQGSAR